MKLLILFIVLQIVNVILSTIRSIVTIKCDKYMSAIVSALYFGFYTVVLIYMNCNLDLWTKVAITAITNLIGVFIVKYGEELARKDKLWKVEFTVLGKNTSAVVNLLDLAHIPHNYIENVGKYTIFNTYCATQKQSESVKEVIKEYNAKYFVSETKEL